MKKSTFITVGMIGASFVFWLLMPTICTTDDRQDGFFSSQDSLINIDNTTTVNLGEGPIDTIQTALVNLIGSDDHIYDFTIRVDSEASCATVKLPNKVVEAQVVAPERPGNSGIKVRFVTPRSTRELFHSHAVQLITRQSDLSTDECPDETLHAYTVRSIPIIINLTPAQARQLLSSSQTAASNKVRLQKICTLTLVNVHLPRFNFTANYDLSMNNCSIGEAHLNLLNVTYYPQKTIIKTLYWQLKDTKEESLSAMIEEDQDFHCGHIILQGNGKCGLKSENYSHITLQPGKHQSINLELDEIQQTLDIK